MNMDRIGRQESLLKDALQYTHPDSGASVDKGYGVLVGMAVTFMAVHKEDLFHAAARVGRLLPNGWRKECWPRHWQGLPGPNPQAEASDIG